ncbi:DNA alkylation repair protein [Candidatus Halocynthiibacter alkanivorans]|uniref:DNA alkylation repair protein n=1 Tax=Candidatus Halocynthiibacter alkanivorans TaxID=2267619 RepID=UPI000DF2FF8D|nr:DNA alkylation repair protein [Candidatus Halocynthiibacter alkanivorans]
MEPFKNWLSPELVVCIADHLQTHVDEFDRPSFEQPVLAALPALELKQRAQCIADHIHAALPADFASRNKILRAMLHPDAENGFEGGSDGAGLRGWGIYPLTIVVGQHGLADFDASLELLKEMTKRGTSEFDVRPFLMADQARALAIITDWTVDANQHVRRCASEGTRPRLPWGMQLSGLVADPAPLLPLLRALRDDPEEYVRRSVANSLNDIAKDHPDLVADLTHDWMKDASKPRERLLRHACRTLIKQGHSHALAAFGIAPPQLEFGPLTVLSPVVEFGGAVEFSASIASTVALPQALIIDYIVHFKKANGTQAGKVFKWKKLTLEAGQSLKLSRKHPIRAITTRKYYAGQQAVSLRINGTDFGRAEFELRMPE